MIKKYIQTSGLTLRIYSKVEIAKISSNELRGNLFSEFREYSSQDISWESEQITKSHGIYLEFNRAKTGNEKDWMYMLRITIPGGGPYAAFYNNGGMCPNS